ncbi:Ig-like and fibronectin type-III domain-containing protein C25G4.10 [Aphelenchoides bicaudatus]|nr:Ig-like and fibronectin type-III domain-containing protein C25G4.10 [Aphelenchoides bicaudatus]
MRLSDCQCSTTAATNYSILPILFIFFILVAICIKEANADKVDQCCRSHGIPDVCVQKLCYPLRPPGDFDVYDIFNSKNNCTKFLPQIAQCLADGRDHSDCCNSEAKDSEQNACFGLCKGVGKNRSSWHNYQSCLAINLPNMFICLQKGYAKTPTPPQNLRLDQIEISSVVIQWEEPEFNVDQVDHYQVVISEQVVSDASSTTTPSYSEDELDEEMEEPEEQEEEKPLYRPKVIELNIGRETSVKVENLQPGTLYNAFVIAVGNNPTERSLSSDMLDFQTVGISPQIFPYKKVVSAPNGAKSAVVACRFHMSSISYKTANIQWQHKSAEGGTYKTLATVLDTT